MSWMKAKEGMYNFHDTHQLVQRLFIESDFQTLFTCGITESKKNQNDTNLTPDTTSMVSWVMASRREDIKSRCHESTSGLFQHNLLLHQYLLSNSKYATGAYL